MMKMLWRSFPWAFVEGLELLVGALDTLLYSAAVRGKVAGHTNNFYVPGMYAITRTAVSSSFRSRTYSSIPRNFTT